MPLASAMTCFSSGMGGGHALGGGGGGHGLSLN
jgi:hypothetical protein